MIGSNIVVLSAASDFSLITLDQVKAYFNITTTQDDARIQQLIDLNSAIITDLCDRVFALEQVEETFFNMEWTNGAYAVNLDRWPVTEVVSVMIAGAALAVDDYTVEQNSGILRYTTGASGLDNEVVVTYSGGYVLPDEAPAALTMACIEGIRGSYYYGSRDPMIQSITDNNAGSIRFFPPPGIGRAAGGGGSAAAPPKALTPAAEALILPYRKRPLA
jgi:hypothetical protein